MARALPGGWRESKVTGGLAAPTSMVFAPDGRLFVTEQDGKIRIIKNGRLLSQPFATLQTTADGERGLLGIELDPAFARTGYVYVYYTVSGSSTFNRVGRLTVDPAYPDIAKSGSFKVLMDVDRLSSATNHNGGAIHFGPDGKLFVAVGENAKSSNSQSLKNRLGKILRINRDGSIPSDNPFYTKAAGANRAIWALGLRNPYTFAFDPTDRRMNINDVGQTTYEEVNRGRVGANYGWPSCEGKCTTTGMTNPIFQYGHSTGKAITGGAFYRSQLFGSSYAGDYFFSDYIGGFIKRLTPNGRVLNFHTSAKSPVDLDIGSNGKLYYLSIGDGAVYRISP